MSVTLFVAVYTPLGGAYMCDKTKTKLERNPKLKTVVRFCFALGCSSCRDVNMITKWGLKSAAHELRSNLIQTREFIGVQNV